MKLRTKLLLGYAGFVLALGILGAWSARTLSQMSAVSGRIIAENYDSVVAARAEHRGGFDAALAKASANITETGEPEAIESIRRGRDEYYRRFDTFVNASGNRAALYFQSLEPQFHQVRMECD